MAQKPPKPKCEVCRSSVTGIFSDLDRASIEELDRNKTINNYKKGQIIFHEGNQVYGLFCVLEGKVKLYKSGIEGRQQIVRLVGPGDILGYRSLLAEEPYHATAKTLSDSTICCIDKNAFLSILSKSPKLSLSFIKKLARELRSAEDLATSIAQKSVRERMAELLLMLRDTYGKKTDGGFVIDLRLSREEMAEMIGATQETAIRLLTEFKKDGMISVKERDVTILNPGALMGVANLDIL